MEAHRAHIGFITLQWLTVLGVNQGASPVSGACLRQCNWPLAETAFLVLETHGEAYLEKYPLQASH